MKLYHYSWVGSLAALAGILGFMHYQSGQLPLTANEQAIAASEQRSMGAVALSPESPTPKVATTTAPVELEPTYIVGKGLDIVIARAEAGEAAPPEMVPVEIGPVAPPAGIVTVRTPDCVDCEVPIVREAVQPAVTRTFTVPAGYEVVSVPTASQFQLVEFPQPDHFEITSPDMVALREEVTVRAYINKLEVQLAVLADRLAGLEPIGKKVEQRRVTIDRLAQHVNSVQATVTGAAQ